jgi:hypothetical protein
VAGTSGAAGGSSLAGIPGLTRTYAPGEKEPAFAELLGACTTSAVHLEMHDQHLTSDPAFQAWLAGQPAPQDPAVQYRAFTGTVRDAVRRGVSVRRARIISEPVSDYVRWEHALTGPVNVAAGEQVRWLPRRLASTLALPGNPYWVFDDRLVRFTVFAGDGEVAGQQYSEDPGVITACLAAFEAVWDLATPHEDYRI